MVGIDGENVIVLQFGNTVNPIVGTRITVRWRRGRSSHQRFVVVLAVVALCVMTNPNPLIWMKFFFWIKSFV
jgi:hypothetical protein